MSSINAAAHKSSARVSGKSIFSIRRFSIVAALAIVALGAAAAYSNSAAAAGFREYVLGLVSNSSPAVPLSAAPNPITFESESAPAMNAAVMNGSLLAARSEHTATILEDGRVLVVGGESTGANEIFDAVSNSSASTGSLSIARSGHSATRLSDGRILIAGGSGLASTEIYDPATGTFSAGPAMTTARSGHTATLLANGGVLIAGGGSSTAEIFDGTTFTPTGAMSAAHTNASAVRMNDGRIFIAGGDGLNSAEIYDPGSGTFSNAGNAMTMARARALLRVLPDGKVQIIGGNSDGSMEVYDPSIDTIGAYAHVVPESDPCANLINYVLSAETRSALIFSGSSSPERNRMGYTITELGSSALLIGGSDGSGATNTVTTFNSSTATVTTDKLDYQPGDTATISGTGFAPGEVVRVMIHEDPHTPQERGFDAVADANGNFSGTYLVTDYDLNMKFVVGARGLTSGNTAQTSITDSNPGNITVAAPTSVTIAQGATANYGTLTLAAAGNTDPCLTTFSVVAGGGTGLPAGANPQWGTNPVTTTSSAVTTSFSVLTTGSIPTGTYTFRIHGVNAAPPGGQCQGSGPNDSNLLTLIVTAGNVAPNSPATLGQFKIGGVTPIATGAATNETSVVFKGVVSDSDAGNTVKLQIEVKPVGTAFTNVISAESALLASGSTASVTVGSLVNNTNYHWQARTVDNIGSASAWVSFGGNLETATDFSIDTTAPTVTINQAAGQADPTNASPINFTAVFSEAVTGFATGDITPGGTAGAAAATITEIAPMNGTTYNVAVSGMTSTGTVTVSILAGKATDAAGNGNTASTSSDNSVLYDATAPTTTITLSPPSPNGNNGWYNSNVNVAVSAADDAGGSGVLETRCVLDPALAPANFDALPAGPCAYAGAGLAVSADGMHYFYAASRDAATNKETPVKTVSFKIDQTDPVTTFIGQSPAKNANGWNNTDVTLEWSCTDAGSGVVAASVFKTITTEGANQQETGTCTDNAGNTSSSTNGDVDIDKTAPINVAGAPNRAPDHNDWFNAPVNIVFNGLDALSGIDTCSTVNYSGPDGIGLTVNGSCTDLAGNTSAPVASGTFKYDATAPINVAGAPDRAPDSGTWYNAPVNIVFTGTDATSGIDTCTNTPYSGPDGSAITVNGSCTDNAGNTSAAVASSSFNYDATAPSGSVVINSGDAYTDTLSVMLALTCTDLASGCSQMAFSNDDVTYSAFEPFAVSKSWTLATGADGTRTVYVKFKDNAGNASAPASDDIVLDSTAPLTTFTLDPEDPDGNNGWYVSDVKVTVEATDGGSGVDETRCILDPVSVPATFDDLPAIPCPFLSPGDLVTTDGMHIVYAASRDSVDNKETPVKSVSFKIDQTAPEITFQSRTPSANSYGWNNTDVMVTWACSDATSGAVSTTVSDTKTAEGANQSANGTCTDNAGNTASDAVGGINIDKTNPTITFVDQTPAKNANGWNNTDVTLSWTCSDSLSGAVTSSVTQLITSEGEGLQSTGTCFDKAGNSASSTDGNVNIDKTPPTGTVVINNGDAFTASLNVTLTLTCSDNLSECHEMAFSNDGTTYSSYEAFSTSKSWTLEAGVDGSRTVYVKFRDKAENSSAPASDSIALDTTAPVSTITLDPASPDGDNGWYVSDVLVTVNAADSGGSGVAETRCVTNPAVVPTSFDGLPPSPCAYLGPGSTVSADGMYTVYAASRDNVSNKETPVKSASFKIDQTAPVNVAVLADRSPDFNGWYKAPFSATWSGDDPTSGIATCTVNNYSAPDTASGSISGSCTDNAGNTSTNVNFLFKYDATDPFNVAGAPGRIPDHNGWYNHAVDIDFTGQDATSGIASCTTVPFSGPDGIGLTVNGSCTDNAGNTSALVASSVFKYDATAPINVAGAPNRAPDNGTWYNSAVDVVFSGTDAPSGIESCQTINYSGSDGSARTVNGTCTDVAGNTSAPVASSAFDYDATAPSGTVVINNGDAFTGSLSVTLALNCMDATSGCSQMAFSNDGTNFDPFEPFNVTKSWNLSAGADGIRTVFVRFTDVAANTSGNNSDNISLDTAAPVSTITLSPPSPNGNNGWYTVDVLVVVAATDGGSGVAETRCVLDPVTVPVSFDDIPSGCSFEAPGDDVTSDGNHTVYAASRDGVSNKETPVKSASFKIDKTDPTISFVGSTPAPNLEGWNNSDVTLQWSCSDSGSGAVSSSVTQVISTEGENQQATGICEDQAGNTSQNTGGSVDLDKTDPTGTIVINSNAAYTGSSSVSLALTCSDEFGSGCDEMAFSNDGLSFSPFEPFAFTKAWTLAAGPDGPRTVFVKFRDTADNESSPYSDSITLDTTAPVTTISRMPAAPNGSNGWYISNVHVTVSASDGGSGVAEMRCVLDPGVAPANFDLIPVGCAFGGSGADVTTDGIHNVYAASRDAVSNKETPVKTVQIKIDKTAPVITITTPPNGAVYTLNQIVAADYACTDATSGANTCVGTVADGANIDTSSVGPKSFTVNATDQAGNTAVLTHTYNINFAFFGFFAPVDNLPVVNQVQAGRAIPLKWTLRDSNGNLILNLATVTAIQYYQTPCIAGELVSDTPLPADDAGSSELRLTADGYHFNWKTDKNFANKCYNIRVTLSDLTVHEAKFKFKK